MTTAGLLDELRRLDVRVRVDGGKVRVSAPRGVLSPELQAAIARHKAELLALAEETAGALDAPIERVPRDTELPLSFAQQRVWFLDRLEPGSPDYTIALRSRHTGALDAAALERAFTELVRRHEPLRTTFPAVDGRPVQRIHEPRPLALKRIDLSDVPAERRAAALEDTILREAKQPFDLERGPLFRGCLIRLSPHEHELLLAIHHIIADGWSLGILARELQVVHDAIVAGKPHGLPPLPLQFADYAAWQRARLSGENLASQSAYWKAQLADLPPPLDLPSDRPRATDGTATGAARDFDFPRELADDLRALSRAHGVTLFMTMLAAFDALLARWTGRDDIIVGSPIANRTRPELEPIVGFFANTLVLRTNVGGDPTFRELLDRVRETCLGAYAHQEMPFEKIVEDVQPERHPGRNPIFQVSFVMQAEATGSALSYVAVAAPFDLTLYVRESAGGGLSAAFEYRQDLFDAETIDRVAWQYCRLLQHAVANPDTPVSSLRLLSHDERRALLAIGNDTATDYPRDATVHGLFDEVAAARPTATALACAGRMIEYAELTRRANRLAHHLVALGVQPGDVVALAMERSPDAIVALLATLKAGGVFLPLDLHAPAERLGWIVKDAGARTVLVHSATRARFSALAGAATVIDTDADAATIAERPATPPAITRSAGDTAYIMYTSGTTGEPKGVAVPHRGVVRLVRATNYVDIRGDDVFLQYGPLSFDASTFEIWGALLNGATLAIAPPGALSLHELEDALREAKVTTVLLTTGIFHRAVQHRIGMFDGLRTLIVGGDVLSPTAARRMRDAWPACRLVNGYGPTENTTLSTCYTVPADPPVDRPVPIGSPIANSRAYVLDARMEPTPIGVPGELWVAGDGLAVGYHNRPALTAERFVAHDFGDGLVERMYRTGDRARRLVSGEIEFLGRIDDQVKIRGFRIEPREVEAVLLRAAGVRQAAVLARGDAGDRRLVAWVSPRTLDTDALRRHLATQLPEYMVPAAIVPLDTLPTNANGKVDRRALPEPAVTVVRATATAARNATERALVRIWQDVLERNDVGVHDDFFALGGHSLLAVVLFTRIEQELGVHLPLATLFRTPTIEGLARAIAAEGARRGERSLVAIRTGGDAPPLFAVPGVGGNVLCFHDLAAQLPADRPFFGLQSRGLEGDQPPLDSVEEIARAFIEEIREVQPAGPYHLLGVCVGGVVVFEMARQLRAAGEEVRLVALVETWPPEHALPRGAPSRLLPARFAFLLHRARVALRTLARLNARQRLGFLRRRIGGAARAIVRRELTPAARNDLRLMTVARANGIAIASYRPGPLDADGVLILAADRRWTGSDPDPRLSWRSFFRGRVDVFTSPGQDSGLMLRGAAVGALANRIRQCLEA